MGFDWVEYFNLAKKLYQKAGTFTRCSDEACQRSAISRAYYAAFCEARNLAETHDKIKLTHKAEDHEIVKNHFINCKYDKRRKKVGVQLDRLRNSRNTADYKDKFSNIKMFARAAIAGADTIFKTLDRIYH